MGSRRSLRLLFAAFGLVFAADLGGILQLLVNIFDGVFDLVLTLLDCGFHAGFAAEGLGRGAEHLGDVLAEDHDQADDRRRDQQRDDDVFHGDGAFVIAENAAQDTAERVALCSF